MTVNDRPYLLKKFADYLAQRRQGFLWFAKRFFKNPTGIAGLAIVVFFILVAIAAPWLAPPEPGDDDPFMIPRESYRTNPEPPSMEYPMGLTGNQYDIYYGVIWGTRTAFKAALGITGTIFIVGIILGSISGFFGGLIDNIIMRFTDIVIAIPALIGAIVVVTVIGRGLGTAMLALILFTWPLYARLVRGEVLRMREMDYVDAARAAGATNRRLISKHILPNSLAPVVAYATLDTGTQLVAIASLSFLGLGPPEGYADWGQLAAFARDWIVGAGTDATAYWYVIVFPGTALLLFVLGFALLGDALQEIFDPRLRAVGT